MSVDLLRMEHINSLPQPFIVRFCGDQYWWPVHDIDVETGLMRIDVCGLLQAKSFAEVMEIKDIDGGSHEPDDWYTDEPASVDDRPMCCPEALIALRYLIHPKGAGFDGPWQECPDCEGAGEIYWPGSRDPADAAERCSRCDGTGAIAGETA